LSGKKKKDLKDKGLGLRLILDDEVWERRRKRGGGKGRWDFFGRERKLCGGGFWYNKIFIKDLKGQTGSKKEQSPYAKQANKEKGVQNDTTRKGCPLLSVWGGVRVSHMASGEKSDHTPRKVREGHKQGGV